MRDDVFLHYWVPFQKFPVLLLRAKLHDVFHAGTVIPTPIEDNDLAPGWEVRHVALHVHLAHLAVGWSRKRHDSENSRADPLRDGFNRAPFARAITAFKHDDDTQSFVFYPVLEQAELRLKPKQLFFVILSLHLLVLHIDAREGNPPTSRTTRKRRRAPQPGKLLGNMSELWRTSLPK